MLFLNSHNAVTEENAMSNKFVTVGFLLLILSVVFAPSPAPAQQSCFQKCNTQIPLSEHQRDKHVKACVASCRAGRWSGADGPTAM